MTEKNKTLIFLAIAIILLGLAWFSKPQIRPVKVEEIIGKNLFEKFTDPLAVKQLEIIRRSAAGDKEEFRIVEVNGSWRIPSHDNYPADAKDQMGLIADALIGLKVLDVAEKMTDSSNSQSSNVNAIHATYGVLDPADNENSVSENLGVKVTIIGSNKETKSDETLVELIIGKVVESTENNNEFSGNVVNRYVRIAGQLPVYIVKIDAERFSTKFDRWIEKNLLDIHSFDIAEIFIDDYTIDLHITQARTLGVSLNNVAELTIAYNSQAVEKKWELKKCMGYRGATHEYYEKSLNENEELNAETLDNLIKSINDLKIVNVTKKPSKLAESLRNGESFANIKADESLFKAGFFLVSAPDKSGKKGTETIKLLASQGDIQLRMKDGICYNLRFGELTGTQTESDNKNKDDNQTADQTDQTDQTNKTNKKEDESPTMLSNRYLFINAEFDESLIPPADIQQLPEIPTTGEQTVIDTIKKEREAKEKSNLREQERVVNAIKTGNERVKKLSAKFADWYYVISEDVYKKIHLTESSVIRVKAASPIEPNSNNDINSSNVNGQEQQGKKSAGLPEINLPGASGDFKLPID
ncbi:MAG: DUF4340 domain-containing protein [Planctomycetaceae bacterium]|jgi:uncharacterized membrane protein|nr:DUF4340 domain-containing protein [Planctomycetaceae bacterium]